MTEHHALRDDEDDVIVVTLNRPEKLNAMDTEILDALRGAVDELAHRDDRRVMLITARGPYFSAGMDVSGFAGLGNGAGAALRRDYRRLHALFDDLEQVEKPVILVAQGPCLGGALEMSLSCDFRLAADTASFGLPEVKLGVIPGSGGVSRLTRLVGPSWARWLAMTASTVDAHQALVMGLVHEVHPAPQLREAARRLAHRLAELPADAVGLTKLAIRLCAATDPATGRDVERLANTSLMSSAEFKERVRGFLSSSTREKS